MATITTQDKVSIRLESGGHSFSEAVLNEAIASGVGVEVEIITPRTTLMPAEVELSPAEVLRMAGLAPLATECAVACEAHDGRVAVLAIDSAAYSIIAASANMACTSPLSAVDTSREGVALNLCGSVLYLHIVDGGVLRVAEALEVDSDADIVYYLERLNEVYLIYNKMAYIKGDTQRVSSVVKRFFKSVLCE